LQLELFYWGDRKVRKKKYWSKGGKGSENQNNGGIDIWGELGKKGMEMGEKKDLARAVDGKSEKHSINAL